MQGGLCPPMIEIGIAIEIVTEGNSVGKKNGAWIRKTDGTEKFDPDTDSDFDPDETSRLCPASFDHDLRPAEKRHGQVVTCTYPRPQFLS